MVNDRDNLTAQESLDIITSMIQQAKGNARESSFYFLLWGWVVVIANLSIYILTMVQYDRPYLVWLITIPAWIVSFIVGFKNRQVNRIYTHYDTIQAAMWISYGVILLVLIAFGNRINYQLNPVILLITALPTFLSGVILKYRPLRIGGAIFCVSAIISFLTPSAEQTLVSAVAIVLAYLIPGYLLRSKKD